MPFPLSQRRAAARNWFHKLLLALCLGLIASSSNAQGVLINHGLDGSWYNPASPGQGMFLETVPSMNLLWGGWYTFDDSGSAREWYTLWGEISGDRATMTVYRSTNGRFDQPGAADLDVWGQAQLRFLSCHAAQLDYQFTISGHNGSIPLSRLTPDLDCADSLEQAHSTFVSTDSRWLNVRGDWLFEPCVDLGPNESHGQEVFHFDGQQLSFEIDHYRQSGCRGPVEVQRYAFGLQRVDKILAELDGEMVIANRVLLTDGNGQTLKQIFALKPFDGELRLTHGRFDGRIDADGFPNQLFSIFAGQLRTE